MRERFNRIFGHVAFLPAFVSIWALDTYFETRKTYLFVGGVVLLAYSLVIVFLPHSRRLKTDDSGESED